MCGVRFLFLLSALYWNSFKFTNTHASETTHIQYTPTEKMIPLLDVYLHNCSDVCVTVFSFQKHRNNKEGKVCH